MMRSHSSPRRSLFLRSATAGFGRRLLAALLGTLISLGIASVTFWQSVVTPGFARFADTQLLMPGTPDAYFFMVEARQILTEGLAATHSSLSAILAGLSAVLWLPMEVIAFWLPFLLALLGGVCFALWGGIFRMPPALVGFAAMIGAMIPSWAERVRISYLDTDAGILLLWNLSLYLAARLTLPRGLPGAPRKALFAALFLLSVSVLGWFWRPGMLLGPLCIWLWSLPGFRAPKGLGRSFRLGVFFGLPLAGLLVLIIAEPYLPAPLAAMRNTFLSSITYIFNPRNEVIYRSIAELTGMSPSTWLSNLGGGIASGALMLFALICLLLRHPRPCLQLIPCLLLMGLAFNSNRFHFFGDLPAALGAALLPLTLPVLLRHAGRLASRFFRVRRSARPAAPASAAVMPASASTVLPPSAAGTQASFSAPVAGTQASFSASAAGTSASASTVLPAPAAGTSDPASSVSPAIASFDSMPASPSPAAAALPARERSVSGPHGRFSLLRKALFQRWTPRLAAVAILLLPLQSMMERLWMPRMLNSITSAEDHIAVALRAEIVPGEKTALFNWWDEGYFLRYRLNVPPFFHGGNQTPLAAFIAARAMFSEHAELSRRWIRYFALHRDDKGTGEAGREGWDPLVKAWGSESRAVEELTRLFTIPEQDEVSRAALLQTWPPLPDLPQGMSDREWLFPSGRVFLFLPGRFLTISAWWMAMGQSPHVGINAVRSHAERFPSASFKYDPAVKQISLPTEVVSKGYKSASGVFLPSKDQPFGQPWGGDVKGLLVVVPQHSPWGYLTDPSLARSIGFRLLAPSWENLPGFRLIAANYGAAGAWEIMP